MRCLEILNSFAIRGRTHQHSVPAGFTYRFHDEFRKVIQNIREVIFLGTKIGVHAPQNRIFPEVIADEGRHIGVDGFVVGDAVAHGIRQGHISRAVGAHQAGDAEHGIRPERERVQKLIVHAAVDHIDALQAVNGLHVNDAAIHDQVAAFDELDAHLLREEAVLEIRAVVNPGRKQGDLSVVSSARRKAAQNARQLGGIVIDGKNFVLLKRVGERAHHDQAIFQHVGNSAGRAHVVFEDAIFAGLRVAHQIDAADVRVNSARHFNADHLAQKMFAGINKRAGNLPVGKNALLAVHILQKQIQRDDPLREAAFDSLPFGIRDDAGNQIEGKQALGSTPVAVHSEGDSLKKEGKVGVLAALFKLRRHHRRRAFRKFWRSAGVARQAPKTSRRRTSRPDNPRKASVEASVMAPLSL